VGSLDTRLAALRTLVLRLRFPGANAISSLPPLSPRSRFTHANEDDEENEQNRQQHDDHDNREGDTHYDPPSSGTRLVGSPRPVMDGLRDGPGLD
jgi:hypothetical protein